jgi:hypothetical protein
VTRELTVARWCDKGNSTWLLSSTGIVGCSICSGELVSVPWASLVGTDVDARREVVAVDTADGLAGRLSGPGVLPIAVLVTAVCHRTADALLSDDWSSWEPRRRWANA